VDSYEINGVVYYKLRDLANALDFSVDYDEAASTIIIDTSSPFANRTPLFEDFYAYNRLFAQQ
jgi:hypothetical protein